MPDAGVPFPTPLADYPDATGQPLLEMLVSRVEQQPFNAVATGIFVLAVVHTFAATWFTGLAHRVQASHDARRRRDALLPTPSVLAELLHFLGEVEVIFGLWAVVLCIAIAGVHGWGTARHYVNDTVDYREPLFVVVIMALASTRPILQLAESLMRKVASLGDATPAAWWFSILTLGPLLGSFITEPAAMTICAMLLIRQFYDRQPRAGLKYASLGLLFVNVSIGGTLTNFAAPPVLMVASAWEWSTPFMMAHFGWRAALAIVLSTVAYFLFFRREFAELARRPGVEEVDTPEDQSTPMLLPVPAWVTVVHVLFLIWTVVNAHYPVLFIGGMLFFIGFLRATAIYQARLELKTPLLVGFFLAGLVIHGRLQDWWIAPLLGNLTELPLFAGATFLTSFNDNALITFLAAQVPELADSLKVAVVEGAVVGGGLTVIANAPNPAGQALLAAQFGDGVSPAKLAAGALLPTIIAALAFRLL